MRACLRAFLAVVAQTPALPAMAPSGNPQRPALATSEMTTAMAACSPGVNRAAMAGGIHPDAVQARRRSIDADDLGREPTRRGIFGGGDVGTTRRVAISSHNEPASASSSTPAP